MNQAETTITVVRPFGKPNQVHKMTAIFIQNSPELPFRLKMAF